MRQGDLSKLARVQVDIPNSLDDLWTLDIKKSTAVPPEEVKQNLAVVIAKISEGSKRTWTYRGKKETADNIVHLWNRMVARDGGIFYEINPQHPMVSSLVEEHPELTPQINGLLKQISMSLQLNSLYIDLTNDEKLENESDANIDLTKVRFNSVQYNIRDLESKIYVPERNRLIVDTWLSYVRDRRTVIFCASVRHAEEISGLFRERGYTAQAVSGSMKPAERKECLARFASGSLKILCACDLLNEGWDCPETEVLFMARPTMSKVLYTQQLGRGMRLSEGKEYLMVFDFVDNASQYNMPQSLHRLFHLKDYRPGALALAPGKAKAADEALYKRGEKPEALLDWPVDATDYEAVDIFNWQEEAAGMISQMEFVRRVDVQSETIERYVRDGLLVPSLVVPMSEHRTFKYFTEESLHAAAERYGWRLIDESNRKEIFMEMIQQMDMSYSYKPVLIKAVLACADGKGRVKLDDIVAYFRSYYEGRRAAGSVVEKANSIYAKGGYTDKDAERNILANPFKRFEDMQMLRHTKTLGIIEVDPAVWKKLSADEKVEIERVCENKLAEYYGKLGH